MNYLRLLHILRKQRQNLLLAVGVTLMLTSCGIDRNIKKGEKHLSLGEYYDAANQFKTAYQRKHAKGGRTPKLSLEDLLMATLQYMREYRTYEQIAADFGIHESNLIRRSQWGEATLIQSGFTISKTHLSAEDTVIVDATELKINRPKKSTSELFW